ncbi:MAG TPA: hypothetical protein DCY45_07215 [Mesotoga sp.]|jgi:hypothetical protein|nr:hypothetical protein [Mesotoga sp.]
MLYRHRFLSQAVSLSRVAITFKKQIKIEKEAIFGTTKEGSFFASDSTTLNLVLKQIASTVELIVFGSNLLWWKQTAPQNLLI